jgi:hypothetical protein
MDKLAEIMREKAKRGILGNTNAEIWRRRWRYRAHWKRQREDTKERRMANADSNAKERTPRKNC